MFLWWGPELIQFYNDAYRPSLGEGERHPKLPWGRRHPIAGSNPGIFLRPVLEKVWAGDATWDEDVLVPVYRNGKIEKYLLDK